MSTDNTYHYNDRYEPTEKFPNGFNSWMETFYECVEFITHTKNRNMPGRVERTGNSGGTAALNQLAEEWADEFEKLHKGQDWTDADYFETIADFLAEKNMPTK
jgi:hypothetical protein